MLSKDELNQLRTIIREEVENQGKTTRDDLQSSMSVLRKELTSAIAGVEGRVTNIEAQTGRLERRMQNVEAQTLRLHDSLETEMHAMEARLIERMDQVGADIIEAVDANKADTARVERLEARVTRLEEDAGLSPFPGD